LKKHLALLMVLITLFCQFAFAEGESFQASLPLLNAAVTAAKQNGITGFDTALKEEYLFFISEVASTLSSPAANLFAAIETLALPALSAPVYDAYYGVQPISAIDIDETRTEVVAEIYLQPNETFSFSEQTAMDVDWQGTITFQLEKDTASPYQFKILSFVIDHFIVEAFGAVDIESGLLFYTSPSMGVSLCCPSFMQFYYEDENLVQFKADNHKTAATLSVYKRTADDVSDIIPADSAAQLNQETGAITYHFEKNGVACFAIAHTADENTYLLLLTYNPATYDDIQPYFEYVENAFSLDMLYTG